LLHAEATRLLAEYRNVVGDKTIHVLDIPDDYRYMDTGQCHA
jgi:predicted protein tyrosine phosphatase